MKGRGRKEGCRAEGGRVKGRERKEGGGNRERVVAV